LPAKSNCLKRYIPKNDYHYAGGLTLEFKIVKIDLPKDCNIILGMAHFIKTAEDLYEALVNSVPSIQFGLGFCESSGPCLVRHEGNDAELRRLAEEKALEVGCGHSFLIFIKNAYPLNVLGKIKKVPEVCTIYAATANPLEVLIAETEQGRGIIGVVDGLKSLGIETKEDMVERRQFLRKIGYKLG
jgi:hypothetical protein